MWNGCGGCWLLVPPIPWSIHDLRPLLRSHVDTWVSCQEFLELEDVCPKVLTILGDHDWTDSLCEDALIRIILLLLIYVIMCYLNLNCTGFWFMHSFIGSNSNAQLNICIKRSVVLYTFYFSRTKQSHRCTILFKLLHVYGRMTCFIHTLTHVLTADFSTYDDMKRSSDGSSSPSMARFVFLLWPPHFHTAKTICVMFPPPPKHPAEAPPPALRAELALLDRTASSLHFISLAHCFDVLWLRWCGGGVLGGRGWGWGWGWEVGV